jgi:CHASE1-domain containing sensor protein
VLPTVLILLATAILVFLSIQEHNDDQQKAFARQARRITREISQRLDNSELVLRGGLGLLQGSREINGIITCRG